MTLTPPQMREEAGRSAFAGPLDKKSCRASDACSRNAAGLFAHLMRSRSEDRQNPRRIRFENGRLSPCAGKRLWATVFRSGWDPRFRGL